MDKLNNLIITNPGYNSFDFAHIPKTYFDSIVNSSKKRIYKNDLSGLETADNEAYMNSNRQIIENKLGLYDLIYRLQITAKASKSSIVQEKLERALLIKDIITNTILSIIHSLYWQNLSELKKTSMPLSRAYKFAIDIGLDLTKKFEQRLDEEYNLANILEEEFSKEGVKKVRK